MADNLIFPVQFDLEGAVRKAQGDAEKYLRQLETTIRARPVEIDVKVGDPGSLDAIRSRMRELSREWNALAESERVAGAGSGEYTARAQAMIEEFGRLTVASESYARSLQAIAADSRRAAAETERMQKARLEREWNAAADEHRREQAREENRILAETARIKREAARQEAAQQQAVARSVAKRQRVVDILRAEENSVVAITAKLQHWQRVMNSSAMDGRQFGRATQEVQRLSQKLSEAQARIERLTATTAEASVLQGAAVRRVRGEYEGLDGYVSRLVKRLAVYASFSYAGQFLSGIREVTAEFELQRVSLGAIIQDQQKANQLFEEIKTFALKSPVKILDLTKYTKQLAAYKIGVDELFDTTKRLTDISVGLGVSMDRIVLMYGQIRATGHLRASEVRQATEAGIPLVEELAKKLSKANGELVTAADVMDMISKRAISFDMVKEVFDDMTSAGGIFYNMQEKQGNTLFGMWQKLGDAAAVMYDQIGNTSSVNEGMKMAIQTLRYLMLHWKQVGIVVGGVSAYILANTIVTKNNAIATATAATANKLHIASLQQKLGALRLEQMNLKSTAIFQRLHTAATISATKAQIGAATSTNVFSKALYGLKAALLSNPLTALAVALTTIIALLMQSESELDKLNSKLQDIDRDYEASGKKSIDRFKELVKAVEENVDGSKAQKEALDELDRTYGKILGSEALELNSLKALGGQYSELIDLIEAYNAKKRGEEKETAIKSSYATILDEEKDDLKDYLNQAGMSAEKQAEFISRLTEKLIEYSGDADAAIKATNETFKEFADDISQLDAAGNILNLFNFDKLADAWGVAFRQAGALFGGQGMDYLYNYARALEGQNNAIEENEIATRNAVRGLDEYAEGIDNVGKALKNLDWSSQEALYNSLQDYNKKNPQTALSIPINLEFDPAKAQSEYEKMIEIGNMQIHAIFANLQNIASQEGVAIPEEFYKQAKSVVEGNKSFSFIDFEGLSKLFTSKKAKQAVAESKLLFESISPNDRTVAVFKTKLAQLANGAGVELSTMTKYFMKAGDNIEDYAKKIKGAIEELEKKLKEMQTTNQMVAEGGHGPLQGFSEEEIKKIQMQVAVLKELFPFLQGFTKGGSTRTSDPRLQTLQEIANKMAEVNKEYDELLKKEGETKALADTQKLFASSFKQMESTAKKYGFKLPAFEVPQTIEDVQKWYKAIMDNIKRLNLKNSDKVLIELGFKSDKAAIDKRQKDIENKLKELADKISRTRTAREFYDKILGATGDYGLAGTVAESIFGQNGERLQKALADRVRGMTNKIELPEGIISADNIIDYKALRQFAEANKEELGKMYEELVKISEQGQKDLARTYEGYLKDLEKAKSYSDKRIELARYTAKQIAEIEASGLPEGEKKRLTSGYREREEREAAKLEYEAFKNSALYVQMFEDLDYASTSALTRMRDRLIELKSQWKNLSPTELKELQSRLKELDEQIASRNPFKALANAWNKWHELRKSGRTKEGDEQAASDAEKARRDAEKKMLADEAAYQAILKAEGAESDAAKAAREIADESKAAYDAAEKTADETADMANEWKLIATYIGNANQKIDEYQSQINEALDGVRKIMESFGASAEDMQFFDDVVGSLNEIVDAGQQAGMSVASFMSGNILGGITSGVSSIGGLVSGFTNLFSAGKVRRANKEIRRQKELLEALEYTYGRLEVSADKVFGRDYLNNYSQQLKNLQAQQTAYLKQAAAERSKGKKADEDAIREYENQARETADRIKELEDDLGAHFTGSSRTDAARQMAKSWVDARASMSDTFAAIKGDYADMIKNMIVEGAAARVIENALSKVWNDMDAMLAKNDMQGAIDSLIGGMDSALNAANNGMEVLWKALEARGYDMKQLIGETDSEYTGIAKSVAGATSEEILQLSGFVNTALYYMAPIPRMDENLARVVALMEGRGAALPAASGSTGGGTDYTDLFNTANEHLSSLPRMEQHLSEIHRMLGRIVVTRGGTFGVNSFLNG